jgi:NAD(P)-dependent dehydrogenase (short-subunit alcohol dehydrogenase family)
VACADLVGEAASETASLAGEASCAIEVDVRHEESVQSAFREADHRLGSDLHVLVNVAGVGSTTPVPTTAAAVWDDVQAVNARGTFLCCREAIPRLTKTGGSIVNVASVAGLVGLRNRAAYCASKGAVIALTRAMAVDHVEDGVRVNCVCPGTIDSPWVRRLVDQAGESLDALRARQPMGRLGTPEEVADAICYLASRRAAFVTGSAFVIDGGLTAA